MTFYSVLGISSDADAAAIRTAYRMLVRRFHPDRGEEGSDEKLRQVVEAYETLGDSGRRQSYDQALQKQSRREPVPIEPITMYRTAYYRPRPESYSVEDLLVALFGHFRS